MSDKPINSLPPTVNPVSEKKSDTIVSPNKLVNQQTTRGLINEPSLAPNKVINSNTKVGPINESLLTPNKVLNRTSRDNSDVKLPNTVNVTKTPAPNKSRTTLNNVNGEILGNGQEVISTANGCVVVRTDKNVYVNVTENLIEQNYIKNSSDGSLCVGTVDTGNVYTNVVSNVQKLAFDDDSGFAVCNLGNGTAKIAMNSTFKYWDVNGSSGLTACGLDTVNFIAGSGVTITSDNNAVPKSLTISASGGGGGTPGGSNCQFQYNNSGSFAGACGLTYNNSTGALGMTRIDVPTGQSLEINVSNTNAYWNSLYGDISLNTQNNYSSQVIYDSLGNAYIVGADGNNGSPYLVKYDSFGSILWQKSFTEVNDYYKTGDAVAVDSSNNVYCLIGTDDSVNDVTIFKFTSSGTLVWQTTFNVNPGDYFAGTDLVVDNSGNVFACLYYSISGDDQQLILKLDNTGAIQWQKSLSGGNDGYPQGITLDSTGSVIISGQIYDNITTANNLLVAKYNSSGVLQWQKEFINPDGSSYYVYSGQITTDASDNIYITGSMDLAIGSNKIYVAKLDSSGNLIWQTNLDYAGNQYSYGISLDSSNNVYISGSGNTALGSGYFLMAKFDNSGAIQWQRIFGAGSESQYYYWSVKTIDVYSNSYIVTGYTGTVPTNTYNAEAITFQLPTDGSLTGTYGNFVYQASNFVTDTNTFTSQSGTAIETTGTLVASSGAYTVVAGTNTNTLMKINGGNNTFSLNSDGTLSTSGFALPFTYGGNGQALISCNGDLVWDNTITKLNGLCSIAIRKTNSTISGADNIAIGEGTMQSGIPACNSIAIGKNALSCTTSIDNIAIGSGTISNANCGTCKNVAIGSNALYNVSGSCNIAVGYGSLSFNRGYENVAIGTFSMCNTGFNKYQNVALGNSTLMYGGNFNVAIGDKSSQCMNSLAQNNVSIGARAMQYGGNGMFNIAMGTCAMNNAVGNANIAIGKSSLKTVCCGCNNIAIGCHAIGYGYNNVGSNNIGIGESALSANNTGNQNVAIGHRAMSYSRDGCDNIAIGQRALGDNLTTGSGNIAIGYYALNLASNSMNIGIGYSAGCCITTGTNNTVIGGLSGTAGLVCTVLIGAGTCERIKVDDNGLCVNGSLFSPTVSLDAYCSFKVGNGLGSSTGLNNFAIGCNVLNSNTTGASNIAIGMCTLCAITTGSFNIAIGCSTLRRNTGGVHNIAFGYDALANNLIGGCNIAFGSQALTTQTSGDNNVALGYRAMGYGLTGSNNVAIGNQALLNNTTSNNIGIGQNSGSSITTGTNNTIIGGLAGSAGLVCTVLIGAGTCERIKVDDNGLCINGSLLANASPATPTSLGTTYASNQTSYCNTFVGYCAGNTTTTGKNNIGIGTNSLNNVVGDTLNYGNVGIGTNTLRNTTTGYGNIAIGTGVLQTNTTGFDNIAVGSYNLYCNTYGCNNIAVGSYSLYCNVWGGGNIGIGKATLTNNISGYGNIAIGCRTLTSLSTGSYNLAVGYGAMRYACGGSDNIALGGGTLGSNTSGQQNIAIGLQSLYCNSTGSNNIAIGFRSMYDQTIGINNTSLGYCSGYTNTAGSNNTFIGHNAQGATSTSSNTITLGDSAITCIRAQVTTISSLSDQRDKTNVQNLALGLQFILDLRPVKFTWNMRDGGKVGIDDTGFIAQEILSVEDKYNVAEYLDMVGRENPEKLEIKPGKLIPILVKAIQELHSELSQVKSELQSVKQQITGL